MANLTSDGAASASVRVALVATGIRREERWLTEAFRARNVEVAVVDERRLHGRIGSWPTGLPRVDVVLLRSKSHWRNSCLARVLEDLGVRTVNPAGVIETCGDKFLTTLALTRAGVPTVPASFAFTAESGVIAASELGYPLVVKPTIGSWGRLVGKVNDPDALETVLDHKEAVGGAPHAVAYLQTFVDKGGRDIRSFVVGDVCIAAIHRTSEHWKTNTALGAAAHAYPLNDDLAAVSVAAAQAVGGGLVAVDLFEVAGGYNVNEVNATMEFRNSVEPTGVDIPGAMADYVLAVAADGIGGREDQRAVDTRHAGSLP